MSPDRDPQSPAILSLSDEDLMARVATDDERAFSELVRRFQEDGDAPFFVLSLKAGGSGLNLTAAAHVVRRSRECSRAVPPTPPQWSATRLAF